MDLLMILLFNIIKIFLMELEKTINYKFLKLRKISQIGGTYFTNK